MPIFYLFTYQFRSFFGVSIRTYAIIINFIANLVGVFDINDYHHLATFAGCPFFLIKYAMNFDVWWSCLSWFSSDFLFFAFQSLNECVCIVVFVLGFNWALWWRQKHTRNRFSVCDNNKNKNSMNFNSKIVVDVLFHCCSDACKYIVVMVVAVVVVVVRFVIVCIWNRCCKCLWYVGA